MKKLAATLLLFIYTQASYAQLKQFAPSPDEFLKQVMELYSEPQKDMEDEVELVRGQFTSAWNSGYYSSEMQKEIIETSNTFLKRRFRIFPFFYHYTQRLILFQKSSVKKSDYQAWAKCFKQKVDNRRISSAQVDEFLGFTQYFVQKQILFDNKAIQWRSTANSYTFKFDSMLKIELTTGDLIGRLNTKIPDSTVIYDTQGVYFPWEKKWYGKKGTVNWERADWPEEEVFAKLDNYIIDTKRLDYSADSVTFENKQYIKKPVKGKLIEKVVAGAHGTKAIYPQFETYQKRFELKNIFEEIDYAGGFSMRGNKFIGSGSREEPAVVTIYKDKKPFIIGKSPAVTIYKHSFNSLGTAVKLYMGEDSIYHPSLTFKYNDTTKVVSMIRKRKGAELVEFTNSYHKLHMDVEYLRWVMGTDSLILRSLPGSPRTQSSFRSVDYFDLDEFREMQGMDRKHPLLVLKRFSDNWGSLEIPVNDFAAHIRKPRYQVRQLFTQLSYKGWVEFKEGDEEAVINEELFDYIKARRRAILDQIKQHIFKKSSNLGNRKKAQREFEEYVRENTKDYDILEINTDTTSVHPSAILDLKSGGLEITGVDSVPLSLKYRSRVRTFVDQYGDSVRIPVKEAKPITIRPIDRKIIMQKDRDFLYNGQLQVQAFTFQGRNFRFKYDDFKVNLDSIDFLSLTIYDPEEEEYKKVLHVIEHIKGDVLLDSASNKSGTVEIEKYPIFNSMDTSRIYYHDDNIMEVTYPKDRFYLMIYPYTIDSLLDFTADRWRQKGYFRAGGIVPDFEDTFIIRKDSTEKFGDPETHFSFGFQKKINPRGMPAYGGRGLLYQELNLSMKGLQGNGQLDYATATMKSKNFLFTVDSMTSYVRNFDVKKDRRPTANVPNAYALESDVLWRPYKDTMLVQSLRYPFEMYSNVMADTVFFNGQFVVKPDSLSGAGVMKFVYATMESKRFKFRDNNFNSDSTNFNLRNALSPKTVFAAQQVNAIVDLQGRQGIFNSNDSSYAEFPENEYICYMDQFNWDFKEKQKIGITGDRKYSETLDSISAEQAVLVGSKFISTNRMQDSLNFVSGSSTFDPEIHRITADEVKLIRVADATIYPSGPIIINKRAQMDTLKAATIVAPSYKRYHTVFNAEAKIKGRFNYTGEGDYEYVDENKAIQTIHFDTLRVDDNLSTVGYGYVPDSAGFMLSPHFAFFGEAHLTAKDSLLTFDGYTELRHNSYEHSPLTWIKFRSRIKPTDIKIPIQERPLSKNVSGKGRLRNRPDIFAGMMITRDSSHVYTNFFSRKETSGDVPVLSALPNAREELKVTKIEAKGKQQEALAEIGKKEEVAQDSTAVAKPEDPTAAKDSVPTNPTAQVQPVQQDSTIALALEGDIFIPENDTLAFLVYDRSTEYYKIAREEKIRDRNAPGNLLQIGKNNGLAYGEGLMSLAPNFGTLRHIAAGAIDHNINTNKVELKIALGVDFILPNAAFDIIVDELDQAENLRAIQVGNDVIQKRFSELLGTENAQRTLERFSTGSYTVPDQLARSFLFSDLKLVWNTEKNSYRSVGKIGISNVKNQLINKYVTGHITIEHSARGDVFNLYFKIRGGSWYFFTFSHNIMRTISSNGDFNDVIEAGAPKDKRFKTDFGVYSYQISSSTVKNRFVRQFVQFEEPDDEELEEDDEE